jgi:hypothetical protein
VVLTRYVLAALLLVGLSSACSVRADEDQDEVRKLRKSELHAAKEGLEQEVKVFRVRRVFIWSRRVLQADLALARNPAEEIAAYENHLKRNIDFEAKVAQLNRDGDIPIQDYNEAHWQRVHAQLELTECRAKHKTTSGQR